MTKNEFLSKMAAVLKKNQILDAAEIINEYEQHFAFKMVDGYSEEEIAAKLGNPEQLAAQYEHGDKIIPHHHPVLIKIGLAFIDLFAGLFFLLLGICGVVIIGISLAFAVLGINLITGLNLYSLIPTIPYWCGVILGISVLALAVLTAVGGIYYWALIRQLGRSFGRFQHNALAVTAGQPVLPSLPAHIQLLPKSNRRLRSIVLISLLVFAVCFVLGFIACVLFAGSLEFWHAWGWFS